jgi:hypothetical protein
MADQKDSDVDRIEVIHDQEEVTLTAEQRHKLDRQVLRKLDLW